ncbi:hypothetical protein HPP92_019403 [Vanilla planifolia]|uniref:Uncharacterized protein n=1 Tax=Vanilla planifolia TaxID=51239 RepID=A0A835Q5B8_VANPL|nr:hypothetical protein HPP92_019403 [Vanilla planifolia]
MNCILEEVKNDNEINQAPEYAKDLILLPYYFTPFCSLRAHPLFNKIKSSHGKHQDTKGLAKALTDLSIGRQRPLWNELKQCKKPLLLLVGEKDMEFRGIAEEMCREMESSPNGEVDGKANLCQVFIVPDCGHAVHLENPLPVVNAMRKFLTRVSSRR